MAAAAAAPVSGASAGRAGQGSTRLSEALVAAAEQGAVPGLDYLVLFASAFVAATFLPFYSEVVLAALLLVGLDPLLLWCAATSGNTLGAVVNWWIGLSLEHWRRARGTPTWLRWMRLEDANIERAQAWFRRYGRFSLLLAWAPVGGDALTLYAGLMRVPLPPFLVFVSIGKGVRYGVVIGLTLSGAALVG